MKYFLISVISILIIVAITLAFKVSLLERRVDYLESTSLIKSADRSQSSDSLTSSKVESNTNEEMGQKFETLYFSGNGSDIIKNINLPVGKFRFICKMTSGESNMTMNFDNSKGGNSLIFNDYVAGTITTSVERGPVSNGCITVSANDRYDGSEMGWEITIESIN